MRNHGNDRKMIVILWETHRKTMRNQGKTEKTWELSGLKTHGKAIGNDVPTGYLPS